MQSVKSCSVKITSLNKRINSYRLFINIPRCIPGTAAIWAVNGVDWLWRQCLWIHLNNILLKTDFLEVYPVALRVAGSVRYFVYSCVVWGPNIHGDLGENAAELGCERNINFPLRETNRGRRVAAYLSDQSLFKKPRHFLRTKGSFFCFLSLPLFN